MLEVTSLAKSYPTPRGSLDILTDVSLALTSGDAAAIVGPSGSGKSTLLYILGALEPPSAGTVKLDGVDPFGLAPAELAVFRNRRIGFVFQDHLLLPQCTVLENVLIPTLVGVNGDGAEDRARELLGRVGLGDRFLGHVERCSVLLHLVDGTQEDVGEAWRTVRRELSAYGHDLANKPEITALNKADALSATLRAERAASLEHAAGGPVAVISGASGEGIEAILRALWQRVLAAHIGENDPASLAS